MLSDEEKNVIDLLKNIDKQKCLMLNCPVVKNNIERQLKIIELNRIIRKQSKEIEELKENNKKLTDEYLIQRDLINPDFLKDYISKEEAEQKEKKAYIDGTNVAHELCNKMWKDKINAEISLLEIEKQEVKKAYPYTYAMCDEYRNADAQIEFGESLLEKEQ